MASSPRFSVSKAGTSRRSRLFFGQRIWLWSIPLAWLTTALILGAEYFRLNAMPIAGDLLDVLRLGAYWFWCRLAWQSAGDFGNPLSALLSKAALAAGFVFTILV